MRLLRKAAISFVLTVCVFMILSFTAFSVQAAMLPMLQNPVTDINVLVQPSGEAGSPMFELALNWARPPLSTTPFAESVSSFATITSPSVSFPPAYPAISPDAGPHGAWVDGHGWRRFPEAYIIAFRNHTALEPGFDSPSPPSSFIGDVNPATWLPDDGGPPDESDLLSQLDPDPLRVLSGNFTVSLTPSSIYEIRVTPHRRAPVANMVMVDGEPPFPTWPTVSWVEVPMVATPTPPQRTGLLMTDIEIVDVNAFTSHIDIYFLDPGWVIGRDQPLIDAWSVGWRIDDPTNDDPILLTAPITLNSGSGTVLIDDVETVAGGDPRLRRITVPANLSAAAPVIVRLEPRHQSGTYLRSLNSGTVTLDGVPYTFASRPMSGDGAVFFTYTAISNIYLSYRIFGGTEIQLTWSRLQGLPGAAWAVNRLEIWELDEDGNQIRLHQTLYGATATQVNTHFIEITEPRGETRFFQILVYFESEDEPLATNIVAVTPGAVPFLPYAPSIRSADSSLILAENRAEITDLEFLAFSREPFTAAELEEAIRLTDEEGLWIHPRYLDRNLVYRVFISDDPALLRQRTATGRWGAGQLSWLNMYVDQPRWAEVSSFPWHQFPEAPEQVTGQYSEPRYFWPVNFTEFVTRDDDNNLVFEPLRGNQIYHIMIYAIRADDEGNPIPSSASYPAFYQIFIPPFDVEVQPEMIASPPLRVDRDRLEPDSVPLIWELRYFEIFGLDEPEQPTGREVEMWHSALGVRGQEVILGRRAMHAPGLTSGPLSINDIIRAVAAGTDPLAAVAQNVMDILTSPVFNPADAAAVNSLVSSAQNVVRHWLENVAMVPIAQFPSVTLRVQDVGMARPPQSATAIRDGRGFFVHAVSVEELMNHPTAGVGDDLRAVYERYLDEVLWDRETRRINEALWHRLGSDTMTIVDEEGDEIEVSVSVAVDGSLARYTINWAFPGRQPILPNTSYVIFFIPYEYFLTNPDERITAFWPTYVLVTTPNVTAEVRPRPTVPVLFPVPEFTSQSTVGVRWRIDGGVDPDTGLPAEFIYELRWSENSADYPLGGELVGWEPDDPGAAPGGNGVLRWEYIRQMLEDRLDDRASLRFVGGYWYIYFRLEGLFVDTEHHIWARAISIIYDDEGNRLTPSEMEEDEDNGWDQYISFWSNPVDIRTLNISPPAPPRSLSQAPGNVIARYNNETEDDLIDVTDPNALNITFMRNLADMGLLGSERADADSASVERGSAEARDLPADFNSMHLIRFTDLRPNMRYYVRARTILTVTRGAPGETERVYSYEIRVYNNPDFEYPPVATIFIPGEPPLDAVRTPGEPQFNPNAVPLPNVRQAVSTWVSVGLFTARYADEFDGVHRPDQFPLPDRDWEITYYVPSQTVTWRFRTNQIGADGRPDQNVDQRFISRLVNSRTFTYTIDLTEYNEDWPITNRVVEVPLSILRAFDERRITLEIRSEDMWISIPPGALNTSAVRGLQQGIDGFFRINLNGNPNGMPALPVNTSFATIPQRLVITAHSARRQINVDVFARPITVVLPLDGHVTPQGVTTGLFQSGPGITGWQDTRGRMYFGDNSLRATAQRTGTFAGITRVPPPNEDYFDDDAMIRVTSRVVITDLFNYDATRRVSPREFNNIVNALANRRTTVTMDANISAADTRSLSRAGLLAPQNLTNEVAVDILVRLYELLTRSTITMTNPVSSFPNINTVTPTFRTSVAKAGEIGFLSNPFDPRATLEFGCLMRMLDILIQDAGI